MNHVNVHNRKEPKLLQGICYKQPGTNAANYKQQWGWQWYLSIPLGSKKGQTSNIKDADMTMLRQPVSLTWWQHLHVFKAATWRHLLFMRHLHGEGNLSCSGSLVEAKDVALMKVSSRSLFMLIKLHITHGFVGGLSADILLFWWGHLR